MGVSKREENFRGPAAGKRTQQQQKQQQQQQLQQNTRYIRKPKSPAAGRQREVDDYADYDDDDDDGNRIRPTATRQQIKKTPRNNLMTDIKMGMAALTTKETSATRVPSEMFFLKSDSGILYYTRPMIFEPRSFEEKLTRV